MRRLPLVLAILFLGARTPAQEDETEIIRDNKSGLVVKMPEGWGREEKREKGSIRFAGLWDLTPQKYVLFEVETGPGTGFDEAAWLQSEKADVTKFLKTQDTPWTTEPVMVGGARTSRFTVGGKANAEKEFDLRIRRCALVRHDVFFRITEYSYNKAHEESADALKAMWEAITFEEPNPFASDEAKEEGSGEEETPKEEGGAEGEEAAPKAEPVVVEDKIGKFKITIPSGWVVEHAPDENPESVMRLVVARVTDDGTPVGRLEVRRYRAGRADLFTTEEPGDVLIKIMNQEVKLFEDIYGAGSAAQIRPEVNVRVGLGGAEKACGYEVRGITLEEEKQIDDAKKLIARGETSVTVPEFPPFVFRGRLAMISPYVFVTRSWFARQLADNEKLVAEHEQLVGSLEFTSTAAKPPPLQVGEKDKTDPNKVQADPLGNTLLDAASTTERKTKKLHEFKQGGKVAAALQLEYVLPPGFQEVVAPKGVFYEGAIHVGEGLPLQIVAHDENNGWVWITVEARHMKSLPPAQGRQAGGKFEDKKKTFETWISNFESAARGTGRLPKKASDVRVGNLSGDGCELEGKISGFHATEYNMVTIESGWWIKFEMKTRGTGSETFAEGIKTFLRKFKATKK